MADARREPKLPPIETPLMDASGKMSPAWYRYLQGERGYTDNVNSGVTAAAAAAAEARATAVSAQTTADAATQGVADVQAGVATGSITFSAAVSPASATGTRSGSGSVTTNSVTVTITGGTGPFTIAWARASGDLGFTADSPASLTTTFTGSIAAGQDRNSVWRGTVTDTFDASSVSVTVGVSISDIS